jgi:adenylate cyclase
MASERPEEAREAYASALAISPKPSPELLLAAGEGYLLLGDAAKAAALLERARDGGISRLLTAPRLAAAYSRLGDMEKARAELEAVRRTWAWVNVAWYRVSLAHVRNARRVAEFFLDPLLKAGLSDWPFGFQGRPRDRLRGADLEALFRGSPRQEILGRVAYLYLNLHDGDGNWRSVRPNNHSIVLQSGTNVIKGDMLCVRSEAVYMGRETCSEVYRNPDGSPKTNDEYLRTDLYTLRRFSIKPLENE